MNPYGAVPAALQQTQMTLRDIMSNYLNQKIQESKLALADKEIDVELRGLELASQKERAATEFNLARLAQQDRTQAENRAFEQEKFGHTKAMDLKRLPLLEAQTATQQSRTANEAERLRQEKMKTDELMDLKKARTWKEWAERGGLTPGQSEIFLATYDNGKMVDGTTAANAMKNFNSEKALLFAANLAGNIDKITDIKERLESDKNLTDEQRGRLETEWDRLLNQSKYLDLGLKHMKNKDTKITVKELEQIKESAMDQWMQMPENMQKGYAGGYRAYERAYIDTFKNDIGEGVNQIKALERKKTTAPGETGEKAAGEKKAEKGTPAKSLSTADTRRMVDALNEIEKAQGKDAAQTAEKTVLDFIAKGDLQGARDYIESLLMESVGPVGAAFGTARRPESTIPIPRIKMPLSNVKTLYPNKPLPGTIQKPKPGATGRF